MPISTWISTKLSPYKIILATCLHPKAASCLQLRFEAWPTKWRGWSSPFGPTSGTFQRESSPGIQSPPKEVAGTLFNDVCAQIRAISCDDTWSSAATWVWKIVMFVRILYYMRQYTATQQHPNYPPKKDTYTRRNCEKHGAELAAKVSSTCTQKSIGGPAVLRGVSLNGGTPPGLEFTPKWSLFR